MEEEKKYQKFRVFLRLQEDKGRLLCPDHTSKQHNVTKSKTMCEACNLGVNRKSFKVLNETLTQVNRMNLLEFYLQEASI